MRDSMLPEHLVPRIRTTEEYDFQNNCILITGATGFVGAFVLHEILRNTTAATKIFCAVRARDPQEGLKRMVEVFQAYDLDVPNLARVDVIVANLEEPKFGLCDSEYWALASTVDTIYHLGAFVNHLLPYHQLRQANVMGILELLNFAAVDRPKLLNIVSSLSVFSKEQFHHQKITEYDCTDIPFLSSLGGYGLTKWV